MLTWKIETCELPLQYSWKISRGETLVKNNFIIKVTDKKISGIGEVAFNTRYGESLSMIEEQFAKFQESIQAPITTLNQLSEIFKEIEVCASLRFGIESAFVHYLAYQASISVTKLLGVNTVSRVDTCYSLPIMPESELIDFITIHRLQRFKFLKIKVDSENAVSVFNLVSEIFEGKLIVDANESFPDVDSVLEFISQIYQERIELIEQPMPATCHNEYIELKKYCEIPIFADESILANDVTGYYTDRFDGVNIKLMKSGSYLKAIKQIRQAKEKNLKVMVGCMIESSLGISSAMNICAGVDYMDLDGFLHLKKDPYDYVYEQNGSIVLSHLH